MGFACLSLLIACLSTNLAMTGMAMLMYFRLGRLVRGAVVMKPDSYANFAAVHTLHLINVQIVNCVAKVVSASWRHINIMC